jgi:hypothetical protein
MNRVKEEKGLENKPGQNNCFLNVVIQSLWHIEDLRSLINQVDRHNHNKVCILCSLKTIFVEFEHLEDETLSPSCLRNTLNDAFAETGRFKLGSLVSRSASAILLQIIEILINHH